MKKIALSTVYLVVALSAVVFVQSCKKDNSGFQKLYATIQQYNDDTKVYINEPYSCWEVGDEVRLDQALGEIGRESDGRYYILLPADADFLTENHNTENNPILALYPKSLTDYANPYNAVNIELNPTQKYEEFNGHQKLLAPMGGYIPAASGYDLSRPSTAPTLEFHNLCALLKVNINPNGSSLKVTRIEVENTSTEIGSGLTVGENTDASVQKGRPLWGDFQIAVVGNTPVLREATLWNSNNDPVKNYITKKVILNLSHYGSDNTHINGGKQITSTHSFYLYLPPVHYKNLHVAVYVVDASGNERCAILESTAEGTFQANTIYPLNVEYNTTESATSTWHTINTADEIGVFTVGVDDNNNKRYVKFSRSNIQGYAHDNNNTHHFLAQHQYHYIGYSNVYGLHDHFDQSDVYTIMNLSQFSDWRLLNTGEFDYILNHRTDANRYAWAVVASVPGIILFPDGYGIDPENTIHAQGLAYFPAGYINVANTGLNNIVSIEANEWYMYFESQGCVFLPCLTIGAQASSINLWGYYWKRNPGSTTPYTNSHQIRFTIGSGFSTDLMLNNETNVDNRAAEAYLRPVEDYTPSSK